MSKSNVLDSLRTFFSREIGLNVASLAESAFVKALEGRLEALHIADEEAYEKLLLQSKEEQAAFLEYLVVSETWFFRHEEAFKYLTYLVHSVWVYERRKEPLRFLSVPCSTGEEPYSISMTLLQAGVPGAWFHIDAVDISRAALKIAEQGLYGSYPFRNQNLKTRDEFFIKKDNRYQVAEYVKQQVHFSYGNIADSHFLQGREPYDVIFCRNLFIYLTAESMEQVESHLKRLLKDDGIIFVSPVEVQLMRNFGWELVEGTCFRKKRAVGEVIEEPITQEFTLQEIRKKADEGKFEEALDLANRYLKENGHEEDVYYLLGVIEHARGDEKKAECYFHKVILLNPYHEEALVYLSLLDEMRKGGRS